MRCLQSSKILRGGVVVKCPFCSKSFDRLIDLVRHVRKKHPLGNKCPICGYSCRSVVQHFHSLRDRCKLHAVFYYLYSGRKKGRSRYKDLTAKMLEEEITLSYEAKNLGRVFYSIYNGTILIRRLNTTKVIVIPFEKFESIYRQMPKHGSTKSLKSIAKKYNLDLHNTYVDFLKVMADVFGGEVIFMHGRMVYDKEGCGGDGPSEADPS